MEGAGQDSREYCLTARLAAASPPRRAMNPAAHLALFARPSQPLHLLVCRRRRVETEFARIPAMHRGLVHSGK